MNEFVFAFDAKNSFIENDNRKETSPYEIDTNVDFRDIFFLHKLQ